MEVKVPKAVIITMVGVCMKLNGNMESQRLKPYVNYIGHFLENNPMTSQPPSRGCLLQSCYHITTTLRTKHSVSGLLGCRPHSNHNTVQIWPRRHGSFLVAMENTLIFEDVEHPSCFVEGNEEACSFCYYWCYKATRTKPYSLERMMTLCGRRDKET